MELTVTIHEHSEYNQRRELHLGWVRDCDDGLLAIWQTELEELDPIEGSTMHISPDELESAMRILRAQEELASGE